MWKLYTDRVEHALNRGEAVLCMGDFNRPLQAKKPSHGTKLVNEWLNEKSMILLNDRKVNTRIDPGRGNGSVLDLAIVSANIENNITRFTVDTQRKMTAFKMVKRGNSEVEKKVHRSPNNKTRNENTYEDTVQGKKQANNKPQKR